MSKNLSLRVVLQEKYNSDPAAEIPVTVGACSISLVKSLAEPNLIAQSGDSASFFAGGRRVFVGRVDRIPGRVGQATGIDGIHCDVGFA